MKFLKNQTRTASQRGFSNPRVLLAFALSAVASLLAMLSFGATPTPTPSEEQTLPLTDRVSVATDGADANGPSFFPSISADGRFVAFHSNANNLVPGDTNGTSDVFVFDRETFITERVSVATGGTQGNLSSYNPSISADGRYVAFYSNANNLVAGDTNGYPDVFVHDRQTGVTERVSVASDGTQANQTSTNPSISADGRYVSFNSFASNLVPADTNNLPDVFVHDRVTGSTELVSVASDGTQGNRNTYDASISADGRFVVFYSEASNLVPGDTNRKPDPNGLFSGLDVFVHDRVTGSTQRVSVASDGTEGNENSFVSPASSFSADDRYVVFYSAASNLVQGDTNLDSVGAPAFDVFVHDLQTGSTERVSVASDGTEGNNHSFRPTISADGRYIAFHSDASNLVPGDTNYNPSAFISGDDVFVHDLQTGATERVSVASDGSQANKDSNNAAISADGRYVVFDSVASNLVPEDTNGIFDIFVRDRGGPPTMPVRGTYPIVPNDPYSSGQWGLVKIRAPQAWQEQQATAFGIKVAVIDSGVDLRHRDLRCPGKLALGASVIGGVVNAGYGANDVTGHGTHVAGIIGACTNNAIGLAGVAPDASILPYRVLPATGPGSFADIAQAIRLATDSGAHVITLSFGPLVGPPGLLDDVAAAAEYAASNGVVLVAAAGGDSMHMCDYPALAQNLICVGATDNSDSNAPYSPLFSGNGPAVVAPGGGETTNCGDSSQSILSLYPPEFDSCNEGLFGYETMSATSMGAAHVSGVAALVYDRLGGNRSSANRAKVIDAIVSTTIDFGLPGYDPIYGSGRVDALAAVVKITPPRLVSVVSRKAHGSAGTFDVDLPPSGNPGIECRSGGGSNDYTLVFTFADPLTSVAGASVTSGTGSVSSSNIDSNDAHNYIVNLTGVTNAQVITVSLANVTDSVGNFSSAVSAQMGVLLGDTTGNGSVNSSDISETKAQSGTVANSSNFRTDVTVNGLINSSDISLVKSKSGTALP